MTATSAFGSGKREGHDASGFYDRFPSPEISTDQLIKPPFELDEPLVVGDARDMTVLPDNSVALVVTSPPYFAGKEYEADLTADGVPGTYIDYLDLLRDVFAECKRVLEPGGRMAVNVANLGRKPYRSLAADVTGILQDDLRLLLRGEIVWVKAAGAGGNCAWGSFGSAQNPTLRDLTERVVIASKGRFDRAISPAQRQAEGLPWESSITSDDYMGSTLDVWRIPAESARRVGHPAPFPVELPARLIDLYTFRGDLVLDPFLGSGSTAVAAKRRGRRYVGYDLDPGYVAVSAARVESAGAEPVVKERPADGADGYDREAIAAGRSFNRLAEQLLEQAGFTIRRTKQRVAGLGIVVGIVAEDANGAPWWFDLTGGFTTPRSGLVRAETLWPCAGRASVLASLPDHSPLVLLTSYLPNPKSSGDRALRALGPRCIHDAMELLSPDGRERLAGYAHGGHTGRPLAGFWTESELTALA